jgi:ABC-type transport system involved in multi-copper enzyme maturation permease subunit
LGMPYVIACCSLIWGVFHPHYTQEWTFCILFASVYSIMLAQLAMALIGGNAIAGERADRSAEFVTYLPIPKSRSLTAKLLLALAMVVAIWLPNMLVQWCLVDILSPSPYIAQSHVFEVAKIQFNVAINGFVMFCVAWLCSSMLPSPTLAVCIGLITPLIVFGSQGIATQYFRIPMHVVGAIFDFWHPAICLSLAPICFAIGTWIYLRRVEP